MARIPPQIQQYVRNAVATFLVAKTPAERKSSQIQGPTRLAHASRVLT